MGFLQSAGDKETKEFIQKLRNVLGFKPSRIKLYELALTHRSFTEAGETNERLEFLGDAVIGMVMSDIVFKKYPNKSEGELTEIRSKLVKRETLNELAHRMGLTQLLRTNLSKNVLRGSSARGNALEALVGAIYIDKGMKAASKFIQKRMMSLQAPLEELDARVHNFKSILLTYGQRENKEVEFKMVEERLSKKKKKVFVMAALLSGKEMGRAEGKNKKKAEQLASKIACEKLGLLEEN